MKRKSLVIILGLSSFLGLMTTIAIAWGCSAWSETSRWDYDQELEGGYAQLWPTYLQELGWERATQATEYVGLGFGVRGYDIYCDTFTKQAEWPADEIPEYLSIDLFQFGWPAFALSWEEPGMATGTANPNMGRRAYDDAGWRTGTFFPGWFPVLHDDPYFHRVPLTVMPLGFAINVGFYGLIWVVFLIGRWRFVDSCGSDAGVVWDAVIV